MDRVLYLCFGEEAKLQRPSQPIAATKSGATHMNKS